MIKKLVVALLLVVSVVRCEVIDDFKIVEIESGQIRGQRQQTIFENTTYYSFQGIPYTKAPVGNLRFELPQEPEPWTGVRDALATGLDCPQERHILGEASGPQGEDCLFINVYTPSNLTSTDQLPVMFYIHGGGFQEGSSSETLFGPDFLIDENVIVVTFNYRLGPFGFLTLKTYDLPKNIGLKDQQYALRWVNDNIDKFGGDKEKVTIFGQSAGATSVHLHSLNNRSKRYFQRAILQSGSGITNWAYAFTGYNHNEAMYQFAEDMGANVTNMRDLITFLKSVDAEVLLENTKTPVFNIIDGRRMVDLVYRPVIENAFWDQSSFLSRRPEQSIKFDGIDMMIGYTTQEFVAIFPESKDPSSLEPFFERFDMNFPRNEFIFDYDSDVYQAMATEVRGFYFPRNDVVDAESASEYVDLFSDSSFAYTQNLLARGNSAKGYSTYYYRFDVNDVLNVGKILADVTIGGAAHCDELCYIFRCDELRDVYDTIEEDSTAYATIKTISNLWANFAKYGNPTELSSIDWLPFTSEEGNMLYISNDGVTLESNNSTLAEDANYRLTFWDDLFEQYEEYAKF